MREVIMRYSGEGEDLHDLKRVGDLGDLWEKLSKVYNMDGLPDEAYSIIGDIMLSLEGER